MLDAWGLVRVLICAVILLSGTMAGAEIYRWTDRGGKIHFTQDLGQVPPEYRAAAKTRAEAPSGRNPVQHISPPSVPARMHVGGRSHKTGRVHRIRVQRAGSSMQVMVRINGTLDVPFIIDTGATGVVLPLFAAVELEIPVEGPGVRRVPVSTANGVVEAPVVMLESVQMGSAIVRDVGGIVLKNMSRGLLGLSFFNHFTYKINAQTGVVTLTENDLAETGVLRGGRARSQWASSFRMTHSQIEAAEELLEEVPFGRSRERQRAEDRIALYRDRLDLLETEADEAHVPFSWRD